MSETHIRGLRRRGVKYIDLQDLLLALGRGGYRVLVADLQTWDKEMNW